MTAPKTSPVRFATLGTARARRIAVAADADPRSVVKEHLAPGSVRGAAGERIRAALAAEGLIEARVATPPAPRSPEVA